MDTGGHLEVHPRGCHGLLAGGERAGTGAGPRASQVT